MILKNIVLLLLVFNFLYCNDTQKKKILFISSYHASFPTIPKQIDGLYSIFDSQNYQLDIEYMDTKRIPYNISKKDFLSRMEFKLDLLKKYDGILVGDDNALSFAIEHQKKLFSNKPIVFFAINNENFAKEASKNDFITGVIEKPSIKDTISLINNFHPKKRIIALTDNTPTGIGISKSIQPYLDKNIKLINLQNYSYDELLTKLKPDEPILFLSAFEDKNKKRKDFFDSLKVIKKSKAPIYHLYEHGIGSGMVGGKVVMFSQQSQLAAKILLDVFNGKDIKNINYIDESPNKYFFDKKLLTKFNIDTKLIPKNIDFYKDSNNIKLTFEEKEYLKNNNKFTICTRVNHYPVSLEKNNKLFGISGDVFNEIEKILNIKFEVPTIKDEKEFIKKVQTNECDFISALKIDSKNFKNIATSNKIYDVSFGVLSALDSTYIKITDNLDKHIFYVKDAIHFELAKSKYPNINLVFETNIDKIINILLNNHNAHMIQNEFVIGELIKEYGFNKLKMNGELRELYNYGSIGINKNTHPQMIEIINKALSIIGEEKLDKIQNSYRLNSYTVDNKIPKILYWIISILLLLFLLSIIKSYNDKKQKEKFETLLNNATDGVHILDANGNIIMCSNSFARMLGYTKKEVLKLNVADWENNIPQNKLIKSIKELLQKPNSFETIHKRKDGSTFDVQISASSIVLDDKVYLYASSRDISEQKTQEQKIKDTNEKLTLFKHVIENVNVGVVIADTKGEDFSTIYVNKAFQKITKYTKEDILGKNCRILQAQDREQSVINKIKYTIANQKTIKVEIKNYKKTGEMFWNYLILTPLFDENKKLIYYVGIQNDITEQKIIQDTVQRQKLEFEAIFHYSKDGIAILDLNSNFIDFNNAYLEITGYTREELLTKSCIQMSIEEDIKRTKKALDEVLEKGFINNFEKSCYTKQGELTTINMSVVLMPDKQRLLISTKNITKETTLRKEIIKAKDLAQKSNQAKSEFLANMSHEIRTPLNGIIGLTDLVLNTNLNIEQKDYLQKVKLSSKSLLNIINDILDYSKIEAGKLDIVNEEFEIKKLIENISNLFNYKITNKGLDFNITIDEQIDYSVIGDSLRITQILNNFIGNSFKFTSNGFINIDIKLLQKDKDNIRLKFLVIDSGIGIAKDNQEKLFKSFSQEDSSTTKKYGGTGLGLVISKQLINLMDGEIIFDSQKDKGSTFGFILNLKTGNKIKQIDTNDNNQNKEISIELTNEHSALIVEDNQINQLVASKLLENIGFKVTIVNDGLEAIHITQIKVFDIIFMDLQMPNMDGFEATKKIREKNTTTPIIALSAAVMQKDKEQTFEAGMNEHLAKPIVKSALNKVVEKYFKTQTIEPKSNNISSNTSNIPKIDGIDLDSILDSFSQDIEEVLLMYKNFISHYKNIENDINLLNKEDFYSYIHKLKGVSGNLKIEEVYNTSKQIYDNKDEKLISKLILEIQKVCNDISTILLPILDSFDIPEEDVALKDIKDMIEKMRNDIQGYRHIKNTSINHLLSNLKNILDKEKINLLRKNFNENNNDILVDELTDILNNL
jgi:PAS domain S-box-containing protein